MSALAVAHGPGGSATWDWMLSRQIGWFGTRPKRRRESRRGSECLVQNKRKPNAGPTKLQRDIPRGLLQVGREKRIGREAEVDACPKHALAGDAIPRGP